MSGVFGNSGFGKQVKSEATALPVEGAVEKPKAEIKSEAPLTQGAKYKVLLDLSKAMDKDFKTNGTLMRLGDRAGVPVPSISTRIASMDYWVFGCGGTPKGRIIEIFGPESAGKTTISLDLVAEVQRQGGVAAFVDAEHALDPQYAGKLGVDVENLFISQPDNGEQALQIVERLVDSRAVDIIVVDSVAALVPKAELEGEIGDANIGLQARLMSQAMRMLVGKIGRTGTIVIFINQIRDKIGTMFGNPETTTGGKALKFFASVRLDVRKTKFIGADGKPKEYGGSDRSEPIGHVIKVKAVKNKVAAPFRDTEIFHHYETGIDRIGDLVSFADKIGVFAKRGSWIDLPQEGADPIVLGNGVAAAKETVKADVHIQGQIRARMWNILNPPKDKEEKAA